MKCAVTVVHNVDAVGGDSAVADNSTLSNIA